MKKYDITDYLVNGRWSQVKSDQIKEARKEEAVEAYKSGRANPIQKGMVRWADDTKGERHGRLKNNALRATNKMLYGILTNK